jgi:predicted cobalt transporter CbtA
MTFSTLLRRGLAAGAAAGALTAAYLWLVVEPLIEKALVIEEARGGHSHASGDHTHEEAELVSRGAQVVGGMATALVVAVLFGIVFAVVFAKARHRLPAATDHGRSVVLAALGFAVFVVFPALKLPANPPAVGDPDSVDRRTLVYLLMILLGLAIVLVAFTLDRALAARDLDPAHRSTLVVLVAALVAAVVLLVVPGSTDAVPDDVPAALLWEFRVASLGQLAVLWATLGLVFGVLVSRAVPAERRVEPVTR